MNERRAKSAQYRLISENETRFFGLSRFDQSFPNGELTIPPGEHYVIRIKTIGTTGTTSLADESDSTFKISTAKKIYLTSPTNLNVWDLTSHRTIQWVNPGQLGGTVSLYLRKAYYSGLMTVLHPISPPVQTSQKFYSWEVAKTLDNKSIEPGKYIVVMRHSSGDYEDHSPPFSITAANTGVFTSLLVDNYWRRSYEWSRHWYCGAALDTKGIGPSPVQGNILRVGYENSYSHGFCEERKLCFYYRGFFIFDLHGIAKKVQKATLRLKISSTQKWQGSVASNSGCCAGSLNLLDSLYSGQATTWHQVTTLSSAGDSCELDLTELTKEWIAGSIPNHGLMLRGSNEWLSKDNDRCITFFEMPTLFIEYEPFL